MVTRCKLSKEDEFYLEYQTLYKSMIGILIYVITSRPNIMQAVGMVAIFQSVPNETHAKEVKRIFKYLKATIDFGL
jgi:hypothetical protein